MSVIRHGFLPRDMTDAINEAFAELFTLFNLTGVEGGPLQFNRDPFCGWVGQVDLSNLVGTTSFGTSSAAGVSPPGVLQPPTLTVPGPPTWTPPPGVRPIEVDSNGIIWVYNGSAWIVASGTYPGTSSVSVRPTAPLVIPTLTVAGPPTYVPTLGELICDGRFLYQGHPGGGPPLTPDWETYYPLNVAPGTTSNTAAAPGAYPVLPGLTVTGAPTYNVPTGTPTWNSKDNTLWISQGSGTHNQVPVANGVPVSGQLAFPTTGSLSAAPAGYLTLPNVTASGTPTMTLPAGTPVWNSADGVLWVSSGGGSFTRASGGLLDPMTAVGDIVVRNGSNVTARLGGNTAATTQFLMSKGTGTAAQPPLWAGVGFGDVSGQVDLTSQVTGLLPPANGGTGANLSATGGTSQVLKQTSSGGAVTVGQLAAADLSNGTTGTGAAVLAASPALTGSPTAPTQTAGDNSTKIATTAFVTGAVAAGGVVSSVFGRTGAVAATSGDYTAAQVTNAADTTAANTFVVNGTQTFEVSDAGTNSVALAVKKYHHTSGTPAAGFGVADRWTLDDTTTADVAAAELDVTWATATHGIRKARAVLNVFDTVARECWRAEASGSAPMIGFLGAAASAALASPDLGTLATTFGLATGTPTFAGANVTGTVPAATTAGTCTGNAATATALQTGRTINGTTFDGTANVTVTAAAGTLTGTTLNSTVVTSSLTSVGTLTGLTEVVSDSATSGTSTGATFGHNTSGTAADGYGTVYKFQLQDSTTASTDAANLTVTWATAAHATRKARAVWNVFDTSARECLRMEASGSAALIGFLGASAVARQTGDLGTGAVNLGLFSGTPTFAAANLTGQAAVANGGTGLASATAYAVLCGGTTSTGAFQSVAGVGTSGQVLTSAGASALPTFSDPITATNGETVLGSDFSITSAAGTYQDTGLSVTLPSAGTYLVLAKVRGQFTPSTGTSWWIGYKLFNSTDSADVTNSEALIVYTANGSAVVNLGTITTAHKITVAASKTIKLYAKKDGTATPTFTSPLIPSNSEGRTALSYWKVGN